MSSELQNKMYHYQEQPPAVSWDKIVAALDEEDNALHQRFSRYAVNPPSTVWNAIAAELDGDKKVVRLQRTNFKRYMAAAAVIAIIAASAALLFTKLSQSGSGNNVIDQTSITANPSTSSPDTNSGSVTNNTNEYRTETTSSIAYHPSKTRRFTSRATFIDIPGPDLPERVERMNRFDFASNIDRYMVYIDGNGKAMRLPKKLYDAMACVEEEITCRQRIESLQQKMANTAITSDFTAILELLNNVKENK